SLVFAAIVVTSRNCPPKRERTVVFSFCFGNCRSNRDKRKALEIIFQVNAIQRQKFPALIFSRRIVSTPQSGGEPLVVLTSPNYAMNESFEPAGCASLRLCGLIHLLMPPVSDICRSWDDTRPRHPAGVPFHWGKSDQNYLTHSGQNDAADGNGA